VVKGEASGASSCARYPAQRTERSSAALDSYLPPGGISGSEWHEAVIPFAAIGLTDGGFNELVLQANTAGDQASFSSTISASWRPTPPADHVTVDPTLDRHAIPAFIYGVNFASPTQLAEVGYTVNRWGGNSTTRYNCSSTFTTPPSTGSTSTTPVPAGRRAAGRLSCGSAHRGQPRGWGRGGADAADDWSGSGTRPRATLGSRRPSTAANPGRVPLLRPRFL